MNSLMHRKLLARLVNYWGEISEFTSTFMRWQELGWDLSVKGYLLTFPCKAELRE